MRALSTLTFLCVMPAMSQSGEATDQFRPAGQEGTLVVTVPSSDGLVIASDTRSTTYGIACNGNSKIVIPSRPGFSAIAATGKQQTFSHSNCALNCTDAQLEAEAAKA
jgi:hypothetical protein